MANPYSAMCKAEGLAVLIQIWFVRCKCQVNCIYSYARSLLFLTNFVYHFLIFSLKSALNHRLSRGSSAMATGIFQESCIFLSGCIRFFPLTMEWVKFKPPHYSSSPNAAYRPCRDAPPPASRSNRCQDRVPRME